MDSNNSFAFFDEKDPRANYDFFSDAGLPVPRESIDGLVGFLLPTTQEEITEMQKKLLKEVWKDYMRQNLGDMVDDITNLLFGYDPTNKRDRKYIQYGARALYMILYNAGMVNASEARGIISDTTDDGDSVFGSIDEVIRWVQIRTPRDAEYVIPTLETFQEAYELAQRRTGELLRKVRLVETKREAESEARRVISEQSKYSEDPTLDEKREKIAYIGERIESGLRALIMINGASPLAKNAYTALKEAVLLWNRDTTSLKDAQECVGSLLGVIEDLRKKELMRKRELQNMKRECDNYRETFGELPDGLDSESERAVFSLLEGRLTLNDMSPNSSPDELKGRGPSQNGAVYPEDIIP